MKLSCVHIVSCGSGVAITSKIHLPDCLSFCIRAKVLFRKIRGGQTSKQSTQRNIGTSFNIRRKDDVRKITKLKSKLQTILLPLVFLIECFHFNSSASAFDIKKRQVCVPSSHGTVYEWKPTKNAFGLYFGFFERLTAEPSSPGTI